MAAEDPSLRDRQPWKAAATATRLARQAHGGALRGRRPTSGEVLLGGILAAYEGMSVEEFEARSDAIPARHAASDARARLPRVRYPPMLELLDYLAANHFSNYIASGGGRDFMRPISQEVYGSRASG